MARHVIVSNAHKKYRISRKLASRYVRKVLQAEEVDNAAISLVFVDRHRIRKMNRRYLGKNHVTDVLSFGLAADPLEGEVYVNLDAARVQGRRYGVTFGEEMARLIIHGTLHLVGYDDRTVAASREMKDEEDGYLRFWF